MIQADKEHNIRSIEEALSELREIVWTVKGFSMEPLIHSESDIVVLERISKPLKVYDVALYKSAGRHGDNDSHKLILHRVIGIEDDYYVILGDNCVAREYVPKSDVIAVMKGLIRDGVNIDTDSFRYKAYNLLWVRPWRFRVCVIKIRNKLARAWWKGVEITSPYTPRPMKNVVKRIVMRGRD